MLRSFEKRPEYAAALDRVTAWTRERFKLPEDATIFVSEVTCALPGCPPRETVVAFWTGNDTRHQFRCSSRSWRWCPTIFLPTG
jgi:nitrate reductase delta subunit